MGREVLVTLDSEMEAESLDNHTNVFWSLTIIIYE